MNTEGKNGRNSAAKTFRQAPADCEGADAVCLGPLGVWVCTVPDCIQHP